MHSPGPIRVLARRGRGRAESPLPRVEDGDLAVESEDRAPDEGFFQDLAGVVGKVSGREVVASVDDDVGSTDEFEGVVRCQQDRVGGDVDGGVQLAQPMFRGFDLALPHTCLGVDELAVQVAQFHCVGVDDADVSDSGGCQVGEYRCPESSCADDEHMGIQERGLGLWSEAAEADLTGIACRVRGAEGFA